MTCLKKIKAFCKKIATPGQGSALAENKNSIDNYYTHDHENIVCTLPMGTVCMPACANP